MTQFKLSDEYGIYNVRVDGIFYVGTLEQCREYLLDENISVSQLKNSKIVNMDTYHTTIKTMTKPQRLEWFHTDWAVTLLCTVFNAFIVLLS